MKTTIPASKMPICGVAVQKPSALHEEATCRLYMASVGVWGAAGLLCTPQLGAVAAVLL